MDKSFNKSQQADKKPCNPNMFHMFNNNSYTDFRTAYKHMLIPSNVIQVI